MTHHRRLRQLLSALLVLLVASAASAGTALAQTTPPVQNGPTPPAVGDPVDGNVSPHGGYSSTTGFCMQCHSVHSGGDYALLFQASVNATCATCHSIGGVAAAGRRDTHRRAETAVIGTASSRAAYTNADPAGGHATGATAVPLDTSGETPVLEAGIVITQNDFIYRLSPSPGASPSATTPAGAGTASSESGGLYCASCHSPHGTYGHVVNEFRPPVFNATTGAITDARDNGKKVVVNPANTPNPLTSYDHGGGTTSNKQAFLHWYQPTLSSAATGRWQLCLKTDEVPGNVGSQCGGTTPSPVPELRNLQIRDQENQLVSLVGYKLLSAYPNHTWAQPRKTYGTEKGSSLTDQATWCGTCHVSKVDTSFGGSTHNHPTGCTYCHGNPTDDPSSKDFPHTSTKAVLLKDYPDAICITCHTSDALP